jgi:arylsulfatase A-like enzyme
VATPFSFPSIHTGRHAEKNGQLNKSFPTIAESYQGYSFAIANNGQLRRERGYDRGFNSYHMSPQVSNEKSYYQKLREIAGEFNSIRYIYNQYQSLIESFRNGEDNSERSKWGISSISYYERSAEAVMNKLKDSINAHSGLFWVHLVDPHGPYHPNKITDKNVNLEYSTGEIEHINRKFMGEKIRSEGRNWEEMHLDSPTEDEIDTLRELYSEQVSYVDRVIGDFFEHLVNIDRWNESTIIIMSDHGEAFGEQGVFEHDFTAVPINELIEVPIVMKYPDNENGGEKISHPVQNADLFATLTELLGWNVNQPHYTYPFTDQSDRPIISKSNTSIRLTTKNGYAIRKGTSIVESEGDISDEFLSILRSSSLPEIKAGGEVVGRNKREQKELEKNLEFLGYK